MGTGTDIRFQDRLRTERHDDGKRKTSIFLMAHQTIIADGMASSVNRRSSLKASVENPVHVLVHAPDSLT
jgi:flavin-dependent dehydrogenase